MTFTNIGGSQKHSETEFAPHRKKQQNWINLQDDYYSAN